MASGEGTDTLPEVSPLGRCVCQATKNPSTVARPSTATVRLDHGNFPKAERVIFVGCLSFRERTRWGDTGDFLGRPAIVYDYRLDRPIWKPSPPTPVAGIAAEAC